MKSIKIMGLCLVAAFVTSAMAVATASAAEPEFRTAAGSKAFSSKTNTTGVLETDVGEEVKCTSATNVGEIEGEKKVRKVVIAFKGCTSKILTTTYKCKTPLGGVNPEEIRTNNLEGEIGYINKVEQRVGLLLKPEPPATLFAEFECEEPNSGVKIKIKVRGSIIGLITPINELIGPGLARDHFLLEYTKAAGKGKPGDPNFEGQAANKLETESTISGEFKESAIKAQAEIFPLISTEIKG